MSRFLVLTFRSYRHPDVLILFSSTVKGGTASICTEALRGGVVDCVKDLDLLNRIHVALCAARALDYFNSLPTRTIYKNFNPDCIYVRSSSKVTCNHLCRSEGTVLRQLFLLFVS